MINNKYVLASLFSILFLAGCSGTGQTKAKVGQATTPSDQAAGSVQTTIGNVNRNIGNVGGANQWGKK